MQLNFRQAKPEDLTALVMMLADDPLGQQREQCTDPLPASYLAALQQIQTDDNNELVVATQGDQILAMMQLTFIPYLTYQGAWRCLIEGVRVHRDFRGQKIGQSMFTWAIERARQRGCHLVQLTTDKQRPKAIEFYRSLGFIDSHEGFKLKLD